MNLQKLFAAQAELDKHIYEQHPVEDGEDRLAKNILALQVELGECANEWRGFKYWSDDQEPRTKKPDIQKLMKYYRGEVPIFDPYEFIKNPLLEEYVDCLHFTLSIGLHLYNKEKIEIFVDDLRGFRRTVIQDQFRTLFHHSSMLSSNYVYFFEHLIGLGQMLGFTWEQIEQAYFEKNAVNHRRQETGY